MKCSHCGIDMRSGVALVVDVYHTLYGTKTEIADKYCLKCYRKEVEPRLPEKQADLTSILSKLRKRQQMVRVRNMSARMKAEEMQVGRVEP